MIRKVTPLPREDIIGKKAKHDNNNKASHVTPYLHLWYIDLQSFWKGSNSYTYIYYNVCTIRGRIKNNLYFQPCSKIRKKKVKYSGENYISNCTF